MRWLVLCAVLLAGVPSWAADMPVTLILTEVPPDTPAAAPIYVAGTFNNWDPGNPHYRLARTPNGQYSIAVPARGDIEFKFTLGSWAASELDGKGVAGKNRKFTMPSYGPGTWRGTVAEWRLPARSPEDLQARLEKILADTHTPGLSVAIADRTGPQWVAGLGLADVAANRPATADTLFRIGSVSKAFAAIAILKLQEEGRLSLQDSVRKLAPEVWFDNPWEATDPVRVVDLLEHTTGWDDMHPVEYAKDAVGMTTLQGLDFYKGSRVSRWRPGTRMSYCNSGPAVAAFIVEKITGQRFEDYVAGTIFQPLGMKTATYFQPEGSSAATAYHPDGKTPYPYWNILFRPAGAINASAKDMAAYLSFYLRRGAAPERMETPTRTWAAQQGLKLGYGLYDMGMIEDGLVWQGHTGAVEGAFTFLEYLPEQGAGFAFTINSANNEAFEQIHRELRLYVARDIARLPTPIEGALPPDVEDYAGWYEPASPRSEMMHFLERLLLLTRLRIEDDGTLVRKGFVGDTLILTPVTGEQFRSASKPAADSTLLALNDEGRFIQTDYETWRRIPTLLAWAEIGLTALVGLALASVLLYAPVWLIASLRRKWRRPEEVWIKLVPLAALAGYAAVPLILMRVSESIIGQMGKATIWSIGLCAATWAIGLAPLAGLVALARAKGRARRWIWRYSAWVTVLLLIAAGYLAFWGAIGLRTWT